jgi:hypothetical protein
MSRLSTDTALAFSKAFPNSGHRKVKLATEPLAMRGTSGSLLMRRQLPGFRGYVLRVRPAGANDRLPNRPA